MTVEQAVGVLDAMTPVYRLRAARLSRLERRVLFALAMLDGGPQRLMHIADRARTGTRATATDHIQRNRRERTA